MYRYCLMISIAIVIPCQASETASLLIKKNKKGKRNLLREGIRDSLSYFQMTTQNHINWTHQTYEDQITIKMMENTYKDIKKDIDEKYKIFIEYPTTFAITKANSNNEKGTVRRKNSIDFVEAVHRNSQNSLADSKEEYTAILQKVYKKSFKKTLRFGKGFEQHKKLFLEEYIVAEKSFAEGDFITAYEAIRLAHTEAKNALWYLIQQKEEKITINEMSECTSSEGYSSKEDSDSELQLLQNIPKKESSQSKSETIKKEIVELQQQIKTLQETMMNEWHIDVDRRYERYRNNDEDSDTEIQTGKEERPEDTFEKDF